jgi:hypothetical protein
MLTAPADGGVARHYARPQDGSDCAHRLPLVAHWVHSDSVARPADTAPSRGCWDSSGRSPQRARRSQCASGPGWCLVVSPALLRSAGQSPSRTLRLSCLPFHLPIGLGDLAVHRMQQFHLCLDLCGRSGPCWLERDGRFGKPKPAQHLLHGKGLAALVAIPVDIAQDLNQHRRWQRGALLPLPVRLGQQMRLAKRQAPKRLVAQTEAYALKRPELFPLDPSKGSVRMASVSWVSRPWGDCACQASRILLASRIRACWS